MDAAWGGVIGGLIGALAGASATYGAGRRQQKTQAREAIADVYATTRSWLQYLYEVCHDAARSRSLPSIATFDKTANALRNDAEHALARLLIFGADEFYGPVAQGLRVIHDMVRDDVQAQDVQAAARLQETTFFTGAVQTRQLAKKKWLDQVAEAHLSGHLKKFWPTSSR